MLETPTVNTIQQLGTQKRTTKIVSTYRFFIKKGKCSEIAPSCIFSKGYNDNPLTAASEDTAA